MKETNWQRKKQHKKHETIVTQVKKQRNITITIIMKQKKSN